MYLIVAIADTKIDMKHLGKVFGMPSGILRFAPDEILEATLGVKAGSVTPFALLHDKEHKVELILDSNMQTATEDFCFHPLSNDQTVVISRDALLKFCETADHKPRWLNLA